MLHEVPTRDELTRKSARKNARNLGVLVIIFIAYIKSYTVFLALASDLVLRVSLNWVLHLVRCC